MAETQAGNGGAAPAKTAPKVEVIEMEDGRKVSFNINKQGKVQNFSKDVLLAGKPIDEYSVDELQHHHIRDLAVRFDFSNGTTRTYPANPKLALRYAGHGESQKYGDELAGEDAPDLDDWAATTDRLHERVMAGEWTKARVGGGMAGTSVLVQALMAFTGRTAQEVRDHIKDWTPQQKQQLRADPEIKPFIDKIESEKAAKSTSKVDVGALKDSLRGLAA